MILSDGLRTVRVHTDWELPLVGQLKDLALIYHDWGWFEGGWEKLEPGAALGVLDQALGDQGLAGGLPETQLEVDQLVDLSGVGPFIHKTVRRRSRLRRGGR